MIVIPFIYFLLVAIIFYQRNRRWGLDLAAVTILLAVSFFAVVIDMKDLYNIYGVNRESYTLPTMALFCFQWTLILIPLHLVSKLDIKPLPKVKRPLLYCLSIAMTVSAVIMILMSMENIRDAMIQDFADVRQQHYKDMAKGVDSGQNYWMLLPSLLVQTPMPVVALMIWFYMNAFIPGKHLIKTGILLASIAQSIMAIIIAGRAALIYWVFDFFLLYSLFCHVLPKTVKRMMTLFVTIFGTLLGIVFVAITVSRFDGLSNDKDPFDSLYAYAGQHVNNFCCMFQMSDKTPFSIDRELPFISKYIFHKSFDLNDHYLSVASYTKAQVNVFDTYGSELFMDMGFFFYILFHLLVCALTYYIANKWKELPFYRMLAVAVFVTFFAHGLFAWPFVHHYTSMTLAILVFLMYLFRYQFKLK